MPRRYANAKQSTHDICGYRVELTRKPIKYIYLRINTTNNNLRVNAPTHVSLAEIEKLIRKKTAWIDIKRRQAKEYRRVESRYGSGEIHYFKGQPLQLELVTGTKNSTLISGTQGPILQLPQDAERGTKAKLLQKLYNDYLNEIVPPLLETWQQRIGVRINEWRLRTMKTRWGTCNIGKRRIWLNRELAKRSEVMVEYIIVHELIHLLERYHNKRFYAFMDRFLPDWRERKKLLNTPLLTQDTRRSDSGSA
jgi:predicted metal-dependent hydrolase